MLVVIVLKYLVTAAAQTPKYYQSTTAVFLAHMIFWNLFKMEMT